MRVLDDLVFMSDIDAIAEKFVTGFKALGPAAQDAVWRKLVDDPALTEDFEETMAREAGRGPARRSFHYVLLREKIQLGLDEIERGEVAPLDMSEIKRK